MTLPPDAPILTAEQMRAAELQCACSLAELMERAGRAVADMAWRMAAGTPILILCGSGNNGGDGYVAARWLKQRGADVQIAALAAPRTELALAAAALWDGPTCAFDDELAPRPLVVDALFGVGLSRPLADDIRARMQRLQGARILAVDLPSGVDADALADWPAGLRADVTLALGALKPAHVVQPMAQDCGQIWRDDLGERWQSAVRSGPRPCGILPTPEPSAHKFTRGMVLIASGPMQGAADLAATAAARAGAGYVVMRRSGAAPLAAIVAEDAKRFEARYADRRVGAAMIGAGYPKGADLDADVAKLWASGLPLVLDAGAIEAALPLMIEGADIRPIILTPHEGEFARAFPDLRGNKIDRARAAAKACGAVVVYKGADLVVAAPDGRAAAFWPGSPWLASAGTGDVLAGAAAAMLAKGGDPFEAAKDAVCWHISKGSRIGPGLVADDLVRNEYE